MVMPKTYQMADGSKQTFDPRPADSKDHMGDLAKQKVLEAVQGGALRRPVDPAEQQWKHKGK
jgi:hypothetical protein